MHPTFIHILLAAAGRFFAMCGAALLAVQRPNGF